jgi:hypothetical protein
VWQKQRFDEVLKKKSLRNKSVTPEKAEARGLTCATEYLAVTTRECPSDPFRITPDNGGIIARETMLVIALELSRTTADHFGLLNTSVPVVHPVLC